MTTQTAPAYSPVTVSCSNCANTFVTGSTHAGDISIEVCSNCHPAYTGQQRTLTGSNQVEKFRARYKDNQA
ncbi:50S ribosomal protein L31 [Chromatiales bacterium (ex Bugula neritina AB1)]|nr:50S ribosomal protein L31 [Chromatiales bacterium (ex Bugula neritina AB1)]